MPSGKFLTLRAKVFAESDLILDVLSKQGERLTLSAKNAVKSRRRFAGGVLEPLNFVEIQYTQAKTSSRHLYVQEAKSLYSFSGLRQDYKRLDLAFKMLQLIAKVTQEGLGDNPQLFDLLGNSLRALETSQQPLLLFLHFKMKTLFSLGFLGLDNDSHEFVNLPIAEHTKIKLSDDEYRHLSQALELKLRELI